MVIAQGLQLQATMPIDSGSLKLTSSMHPIDMITPLYPTELVLKDSANLNRAILIVILFICQGLPRRHKFIIGWNNVAKAYITVPNTDAIFYDVLVHPWMCA